MTSIALLPYFPQLISTYPAQKTIRQSTALSHCITFSNREGEFCRAAWPRSKNPFPGRDGGEPNRTFLREKVFSQQKPKKPPSCERSAQGAPTQRHGSGRGQEEPAVPQQQHRALILTRETQPRSGPSRRELSLRTHCAPGRATPNTDPFLSIFMSFCFFKNKLSWESI